MSVIVRNVYNKNAIFQTIPEYRRITLKKKKKTPYEDLILLIKHSYSLFASPSFLRYFFISFDVRLRRASHSPRPCRGLVEPSANATRTQTWQHLQELVTIILWTLGSNGLVFNSQSSPKYMKLISFIFAEQKKCGGEKNRALPEEKSWRRY